MAQRILGFEMTSENVLGVIQQETSSPEARAFKTILRNRVNHGGILAPGSGVIKKGEKGKGIASRWYPETLAKRIRGIAGLKDRIDFIQGDGITVMEQWEEDEEAVFFIDPPYTVGGKRAGRRLYKYFRLDHQKLFKVSSGVAGDFLMTYDNAPEVHTLVSAHNFDSEAVSMKNTHHAKMTELLIGRNLQPTRSVLDKH